MGTTAAGITGGNPRGFTVAERVTLVTEHKYGLWYTPTNVDTKEGNAPDAWSAAVPFDWATQQVLVRCTGFNMFIQFSYDGVNFQQDRIPITAGEVPLPIKIQAKAFRVRNAAAGQVAAYVVTGLILY